MIPVGPATRIYLAAGTTDLRNHSVRLIIPSSTRRSGGCWSNPTTFVVSDSE
jgi:hypothetical protein